MSMKKDKDDMRDDFYHDECGGTFSYKDIKIKGSVEYETGTEYLFDCPCCGKETDTLSCF